MPTTIDADTLEDIMSEEDVRILNVLPPSSFQAVHIPGSENVPLEELKSRAHEILDEDESIVVHCTDAGCGLSPRAARFLAEEGFERVYDFEGGLAEWIRSGREVVREGAGG